MGMTIKETLVKFTKVGVFPSQRELLKLAYIMNVRVAKPNQKNPWHLDYVKILQAFQLYTPTSLGDLKDFVKKQLDWPFFEFVDRTLWENMWRLRSFFQALHPIGLAFVEGNHRAVLASKMLYGQKLESSYPLHFGFDPSRKKGKQNKSQLESKEIPPQSPLFFKHVDIKVLVPKGGENLRAQLITEEMLVACRQKSQEVAGVLLLCSYFVRPPCDAGGKTNPL
jgi:hypothetical protein